MSEYNHFPKDMVEITVAEFARSKFFSYHPTKVEHRQVCRDKDNNFTGVFIPLILYWFDDHGGIAIGHDFHAGTVTYYKFGCQHKGAYEIGMDKCRELGITHYGRCWHVYECPDCGEHWSTDSSD